MPSETYLLTHRAVAGGKRKNSEISGDAGGGGGGGGGGDAEDGDADADSA
jgi:hypothetical protein